MNAETASVLAASPSALTDKNLFAYCDNNPVARFDNGGQFWDIFFDVVSIIVDVVDVIANPSSGAAWASFGADIACAVVPGVSGGGSIIRAASKADDVVDVVKTVNKVADVVDTTQDIAKTANKVKNVIGAPANGIRYTDKVLKQMNNAADLNHAFPSIIDTFVDINSGSPLKGDDGIMRTLIELPGSINNTPGFFEYIIEPNGMCNHRCFKKLR